MGKFIFGAAAAVGLYAGGKALSAYAEKNPELKAVKDKITGAKNDLASDCKEIAAAVAAAVKSRRASAAADKSVP